MNCQLARHSRWIHAVGVLSLASLIGPVGALRAGDSTEECTEECKQRVLAEVEDCLLETDGDRELCYEGFEARVWTCVREFCTDPPPPPPPELGCEDRCHRALEERIQECETLGPEADWTAEECIDDAHRALDDCLRGCIEPPPPSCRDRCKAHGQEVLQQCLDAGGTEEGCWREVQAAVAECIRASCETEPPPEPGCEDRCHIAFEAMLERCAQLGADGEDPDDPTGAECERAAHEALALCMESCMEPPPPPPPSCRERCKLKVEAEVQDCLESQADGVGEECWVGFERRVEACIASSCEDLPPLPCEDRCVALHDRLIEELMQSGDPPDERKLHEIEITFQRCLESCVEPPPPPGETCEARCEQLGQEIRSECLLADGTYDEGCLQQVEPAAVAAVARCLKGCGEPPPPPEPTCKELCVLHAREALQACRDSDGSEADCEAAYHQALQECVAETCPVEPPPVVPCEDRCEKHARSVFQACLEDGGDEETCQARMAEAFRRCALGCSEPPPPEPPCEVACEERMARFLEECIETSEDGVIVDEDGIAVTCDERAQQVLDRCLTGCGDEGEPPLEPPPCDESCVAKAEEAHRACIEAGGDPEACRQRVNGILALCLERCGAPEPCEDRCALAAQIVMEGCALGGLPSEQCKRLANVVLEGCVSACNPPLGCEERCAEVVQRAVRECYAKDGTEEECEILREDMTASCLARCGGEPMPPCEIQCEEKADALFDACLETGMDEAQCAEERARFLRECQRLHSESCVEEIQADLTMFRSFIRGDANRDRSLDVTDPIFVLNWLFTSGDAPPCEDAADANDDGRVDISDPITTLRHLFLGAEALPEPSSREGQDGTSDALLCTG